MNEMALLHVPDTKDCFALGVHTAVLRLRADKKDRLDRVTVLYASKYVFAQRRKRAQLTLEREDRLFAYYSVTLDVPESKLAYVFEIISGGKTVYYSEDGLSSAYDFELGYYNFFQLPFINAADVHTPVKWMESAVFYQIFVDRFCVGDTKKDASFVNLKWGEKPNPKSFAGGDLRGIIQRLDYLHELGINALYLTPIFTSVSNHKYDISDYFNVDPHFGTNADFKELVGRAHDLGIRVVLDAVFNHCSDRLPQFTDVAARGKESPYHDWFFIDGDLPDAKKGNYECFGDCRYMPKFNTSVKAVQDFLLNVAVHWVEEYGIDGWRLDVSDEVSHDFWRKFRAAVKTVNADCVLIGENWHDASTFLRGDQYDSIMNYAFTKACLDYFAFDRFTAEDFAQKLNSLLMRNTDTVNAMMLNLLDSHDTHRFLTQVKGDRKKLLAATAVLTMFVGAPCIYYGTELAMEGGYDPDCRRTFDWDEVGANAEFTKTIKALIGLKRLPALKSGTIEMCSKNELFKLTRVLGAETVRLRINGSALPVPVGTEGAVLSSQCYGDGVLLPGGFVVDSFSDQT